MHLIKDSPNPAAGLAFAAWWLSERGQHTIGDTGPTPIHSPTASTHDLFRAVIPEGVTIRPEAYNNPTYQGAAYTQDQDPWHELFNEHFVG